MPIVVPASDPAAFSQLRSQAGMGQVAFPPDRFPNPLPVTIAASGTWLSGLLYGAGYRFISVGVTSTQAGALVIQQYLDLAGTIARPPSSTAIVAATPLVVDIADLKPFVTFTLQVSNTSGSTATLSGFQAVLGAG